MALAGMSELDPEVEAYLERERAFCRFVGSDLEITQEAEELRRMWDRLSPDQQDLVNQEDAL